MADVFVLHPNLPIGLRVIDAELEAVRDLVLSWIRDKDVATFNNPAMAVVINWSELAYVVVTTVQPEDESLPLFAMNMPT